MDAGALILWLGASSAAADVSAALASSSRPALCAPAVSSPSSEVDRASWNAVREGELSELCLELARATVRLTSEPRAVLARARELTRRWPARSEPWLLLARTHVRLGEYAEALRHFREARERGADLHAAHVLRDYAVAAAMAGQREAALVSYRALIPLASLWPEPLLEQRLYLEAAAAAMAAGAAATAEANALLAAVRPRVTSSGLRTVTAGLEALLAHRTGQARLELERTRAAEVWYFVRQVQGATFPGYWPVIPRHELEGAASLLVERYSKTEAAELWALHVAGLERSGADATLLDNARKRLRFLRGAPEGSP